MSRRLEVDGLTREQVLALRDLRHTIIKRCYTPSCEAFEYYGGRGIRMCDEWRNSALPFIRWAATSGYAAGLQIDRIDGNGNYEPSNCRWVTRSQNQQNKHKRKPGKHRFKGVHLLTGKLKRPWQAIIRGKHVGVFATEEEAAQAYDAKALQLFGQFAQLNFPIVAEAAA